MRNGYYDEQGQWRRTKFCFVYCRERCTCTPPNGVHYNPAFDTRATQTNKEQDEMESGEVNED